MRILTEAGEAYYYLVEVTAEEETPNSRPIISPDKENPAAAEITLGETWELDLSSIFIDADGDALTYSVSVDGGAATEFTDPNYTYQPETTGTVELVFTANDTKDTSEAYTVTLMVNEAGPTHTIETTVTQYNLNHGLTYVDMGHVSITRNGVEVGSEVPEGSTVTINAVADPFLYGSAQLLIYDSQFDHWEISGVDSIDTSANPLTFDMSSNDISVKAVFVQKGSKVTLSANDYSGGDVCFRICEWFSDTSNNTYDFNSQQHGYDYVSNIVAGGAILDFDVYNNYSQGYDLTEWIVKNVTTGDPVDVTYIEHNINNRMYTTPQFVVDGTSEYTVRAIFEAKDFGGVNVTVNDPSMGSATVQSGSEGPAESLTGVVVGKEVILKATPNTGYVFKSWSASYEGGTVEITNADQAEASFIMPSTNHKDISVLATFEKDPNYFSEECELKDVMLLDSEGNKIGIVNQDGMAYEIVLPAGTDTADLANMVLKLTASENAKIRKTGDGEDWPADGKACGMQLDVPAEFVVTAEDGTHTNNYTIVITVAEPDAPVLSNGSAERTGERTAVVKFTSSEAGTYYYQLVEKGGNAEVDTATNGYTAIAGENTINLNNLTADARDILIVVKNALGAVSEPLRVEIPEYEEPGPSTGEYTISVSAPAGGTLVTNVTSANEGDSVFLSATPDPGYRMVEDSLAYTLNVAGGGTVKIIGNRFQMPAGDVTVTCQWEKIPSGEPGSETGSEGILSFAINGVKAVIGSAGNNSYMITLTLPHGTDVTNLVPAIIVADGVTLTPGIGEAIDFTRPVTYTATLADGTELTYVVSVYVQAGSLAESMWEKLIDFYNQIPWWQYAEHQQSYGNYPIYW